MEVSLLYRIRKSFGGSYIHFLNNVIAASAAGFDVYADVPDDVLKTANDDLRFLGHEVELKKMKDLRGLVYARTISLKYDIKMLTKKIDVLELNSMPLWLGAEGIKSFKEIYKIFAISLRDLIDRALVYKAKKVIVVSSVARSLLLKDTGRGAEVVPNQPLPGFGEKVSVPDEFTFCFPSSYYYSYQGFDIFMKAVKELGIKDKVLLIGKAKVEGIRSVEAHSLRELAKVYSMCSAFVSPHLDSTPVPFFGSPTKVVDALASNKALIASDLPSIKETIEVNLKEGMDCIKYVKPGDVEDLKEALKSLLRERPSCVYKLKEGPIARYWKSLSSSSA